MNIELLSAAFANLLRQAEAVPGDTTALVRLRMLQRDEGAAGDWLAAAAALLPSAPSLAVAMLDRGLLHWPDDIAMRYLRGNALRLGGQPAAAEEALRDVIRRMPRHVDASISLAYLLREQGRMTALAEVVVRLWHRAPRSASGDLRTLSFLRECGRLDDAAALLPAILASPQEDSRTSLIAGEIMLALGRFDEARAHLAGTVAADANTAAAWLRLAHTHRFVDRADPDLLALDAASRRRDLSEDTRVCIGFGLGKAHDDLGQTVDAVRCLSAANARWHQRRAWPAGDWPRFVEHRARKSMSMAPRPVHAEVTPVFVVGLPRTGTTLVASLLARDGRVRNRGELNWIAKLAGRLRPEPTRSALDAAARLYLLQLQQDDAPARIYIDKNPLNFRDLDLIAAMLPNARVVHCRRDLRDTALSLWSAHFMHEDMGWSYAFEDIATYMDGYATLMHHWREHCPLPILDVDYGTLIAEPDAGIARLRDFLALGGPQPVPVRAADAITTASVWQARQQIYATSVGRWQRYAEHLPALARFGGERTSALNRPA